MKLAIIHPGNVILRSCLKSPKDVILNVLVKDLAWDFWLDSSRSTAQNDTLLWLSPFLIALSG
jgi:hypothetical protein